jgi:hypothetical protein
MRTLLTVKPQADYLNSTYTWRIQFLRESRTFAAFLRAHMGHRECDWERTVAPWRAVSTGGVAVVPVRDPGSDRPLVERVLSAVGLGDRAGAAITEDDLGVVENSSPGPLAVEVCRRLRAEGAAFRPDVPAREISRFVEQAARAAGLDRAPFAGLDEDLRARVAARWSAANERFAASVWQAPWSDRVASAAPRPVNEVARSSASAETEAAVRDLLRRTAEAFGAAPNRGPAGLLHRAVAVPATALRLLQRRVRMATRA